jgi:Glycosyl transferase family 2
VPTETEAEAETGAAPAAPRVSVIVPAHNEERVVGTCLDALLLDSAGELEVVLVANGCADGTADVGRSYGGRVRVVETSRPGKGHALDLGDAAARAYPRCYVDADVVVGGATVLALADALERTGRPVGAPRLRLDLTGASRPVRRYYDVWARLPYVRSAMVGSGVYALTRAGRARLPSFTGVVNDDGLVRRSFAPAERLVLDDGAFTMRPARRLGSLIRRRARVLAGNAALRACPASGDGTSLGDLGRLMWRERVSPLSVAVFLAVWVAARALAQWRALTGARHAWGRDDSSREGAPA